MYIFSPSYPIQATLATIYLSFRHVSSVVTPCIDPCPISNSGTVATLVGGGNVFSHHHGPDRGPWTFVLSRLSNAIHRFFPHSFRSKQIKHSHDRLFPTFFPRHDSRHTTSSRWTMPLFVLKPPISPRRCRSRARPGRPRSGRASGRQTCRGRSAARRSGFRRRARA